MAATLLFLPLALAADASVALLPPSAEAAAPSANCSQQGRWLDGRCECRPGFVGLKCELCAGGECLITPPELCAPACKPPAVCRKGVCVCPRGMCGAACDWPCDCGCGDGFFAHGVCDEGVARCESGWTGACCEKSPVCSCPCAHGSCESGSCVCDEGWQGDCCDLVQCPSDCCGLGACVGGSCVCDQSLSLFGIPLRLGGAACTEAQVGPHGRLCAGCSALAAPVAAGSASFAVQSLQGFALGGAVRVGGVGAQAAPGGSFFVDREGGEHVEARCARPGEDLGHLHRRTVKVAVLTTPWLASSSSSGCI